MMAVRVGEWQRVEIIVKKPPAHAKEEKDPEEIDSYLYNAWERIRVTGNSLLVQESRLVEPRVINQCGLS